MMCLRFSPFTFFRKSAVTFLIIYKKSPIFRKIYFKSRSLQNRVFCWCFHFRSPHSWGLSKFCSIFQPDLSIVPSLTFLTMKTGLLGLCHIGLEHHLQTRPGGPLVSPSDEPRVDETDAASDNGFLLDIES